MSGYGKNPEGRKVRGVQETDQQDSSPGEWGHLRPLHGRGDGRDRERSQVQYLSERGTRDEHRTRESGAGSSPQQPTKE